MKGDVYIKLIRFFHGPFLSSIANVLEVDDTPEMKGEIKQMIKDKCDIESMADLTAVEIGEVITEIALIFAVELGAMLPYPGEPDDIEELTMREFLELKK